MKLQVDSRKIEKGDIFLALKGVDNDGHDYIEQAIKNGASKIIAEHGSYSVETQIVKDTREYLSNYLKDLYKDVRKKMKIIGITGTNGKTTTAYLTYKALWELGIKAAYVGTVGFFIQERIKSSNNTTPDLYDLYELINQAYNAGCTVFIMETSSEGIACGRIRNIDFDMALFTNLTHEHLNSHKTMENYALAKQQLFKQILPEGKAIINVDSDYKDYYLLMQNNNITYGFSKSDYEIVALKMNESGSKFSVKYNNHIYEFETKLVARYNIYNLLSSIILLHEMGNSFEEIKKVVPELNTPDGRMDIVNYKKSKIIIDYAHTPDGMEKIISAEKEITKGNVYVVFGCTGSRDRTKRPVMMDMAVKNCAYTIVTSDDLHDEEFSDIVKDMTQEVNSNNYKIVQDRKEAIIDGINLLKDNDTLLILGKGHEDSIVIKDKRIPFKDKNIVQDYLNSLK